MRRTRVLLMVGLVWVVLVSLGMGDLGGSSDQAPRAPRRNFTGTVVDRSLNQLAVSHVHCEGKTEIKGYLGEMRISLAFDKVERVTFAKGETGFTHGTVAMRDGQTKEMRFKDLTRCYGESDLGQVMIRVKDLRSIQFNEPPAESEDVAP